jgi:hypothetical protein
VHAQVALSSSAVTVAAATSVAVPAPILVMIIVPVAIKVSIALPWPQRRTAPPRPAGVVAHGVVRRGKIAERTAVLLVTVDAAATDTDGHAKRAGPLLGLTLDSDLGVFRVPPHGRLSLFLVPLLEVCLILLVLCRMLG